jgi:hypothetical protein
MANNRLARPYFERPSGFRWPLGFAARRSLGKYHTGGTWSYTFNTVGGITRRSHRLIGGTWHGESAITYRVRRGNGSFGSKDREIYQDQYPYFIPSSINNSQGAAARTALATAVYNWKNVLTEEQKIAYNKRATRGLRMSGFNIYIREYIKANT